jgi:energy-coupling factor transporter ATP-binding protein EcfA2
VYIDKVQLTNIRGFKSIDFSFGRGGGNYAGWTVFTGNNGSGKSTLLKAIAIALNGSETARALQPSFRRWVADGAVEGLIELDIVRNAEDDLLNQSGKAPGPIFPVCIALSAGLEPSIEAKIPASKIRSKNYMTPQQTLWTPGAKGWFSCGYGPFRRVFGASQEATRHMVASTTARFVTMFQEDASLAEVDRWMRDLNYKALEAKAGADEQLSLVLELLRDDLLPNQITVETVDSDGLWLRDKNGLPLSWQEMSDGYRSALALLADILRHLINVFGIEGLTARDSDGRILVQRSGVVLIDEIDAHLHPEWQREIGFWLKRHFPNIQFLVTSHSPLICQAADPNGLFVLPEPGSDDKPRALSRDEYHEVVSSRPDTILRSPAFGLKNTRSDQAVDARRGYARLKARERAGVELSSADREQMAQLSLFVNPDEAP